MQVPQVVMRAAKSDDLPDEARMSGKCIVFGPQDIVSAALHRVGRRMSRRRGLKPSGETAKTCGNSETDPRVPARAGA